jgi:hypothetical protein
MSAIRPTFSAKHRLTKGIRAISDEMRDVIETEWPELAAKLLPPGHTPQDGLSFA